MPVHLNLTTVWLTKLVSKIQTCSWSELVTSSNSRLSVWWRNAPCVDRGLLRCEVMVWVDTYLLAAIEQLTQHSVKLSSRRFFVWYIRFKRSIGSSTRHPPPLSPCPHPCPLFLTVAGGQRFDFLRENYLATTVFVIFQYLSQFSRYFNL